MEHLLNKIGLRFQIGLIGLIGVAIMITVAALTYSSIQHQEQMQQRMDGASAENDLVSAIDVGMLQARRHEKDFFLRSDEKFVAQQQASVQKANTAIDGLIAALKRDEDVALARTVKTEAGRYSQKFSDVAALALLDVADICSAGHHEAHGKHGQSSFESSHTGALDRLAIGKPN